MQFINLSAQYNLLRHEILEEMDKVCTSAQFIGGPAVTILEKQLADYVGVSHCFSCANGTDALVLALRALEIGPGDEVITATFSFIAAAEAIALVGATPVFVDVLEKDYLLNPQQVRAKIGPRTRAIIAVSLFGQVPAMDELNSIATEFDLALIEDGAQSFGATYKVRKSLSLCLLSTTSFFPTKPLGCYGDGGAVFTQSDELAQRLKMLRNHGQQKKYEHQLIGYNSRLDTLQAAVLSVKLKFFSSEWEQRQILAARYYEGLKNIPCISLPKVEPHLMSSWAQYCLRSPQREKIVSFMQLENVPIFIHYPSPLHLQPCFSHLGYKEGDFPVAEKVSKEIFALPFGPYMTAEEQGKVIGLVKRFHYETAHNQPIV